MESLAFYIRYLAKVAMGENPEMNTPDDTSPSPDAPENNKLKLEKISVSFYAPQPNNTETLTMQKNKSAEANFQWNKYSLLLSDGDQNPAKKLWLRFAEKLDPWGTVQPGDAELKMTNASGITTPEFAKQPIPEGITIDLIRIKFKNYLQKPEFEPNQPESMIEYINAGWPPGSKKEPTIYTPTNFKKIYENGTLNKDGTHFYILMTKEGDIKSPLGKTLGKNPSIPEKRPEPGPGQGPEPSAPAQGPGPEPGPAMPAGPHTRSIQSPIEQHTPNLQNLKK
jgi:hypothetical protein